MPFGGRYQRPPSDRHRPNPNMLGKRKKHEDTTVKLDMSIEQALRKAVDAGPYPKEPAKKRPSRSGPSTSPRAPRPGRAK